MDAGSASKQIFPDETIISADGDIVDLPGNVLLIPVTELGEGVQLISHPNKEEASFRVNLNFLLPDNGFFGVALLNYLTLMKRSRDNKV